LRTKALQGENKPSYHVGRTGMSTVKPAKGD
jgi:hypothetical protein